MIADPATAAAFKAASTLTAKAEAVRDALGDGTLTVTVRDGATTHFTGTIAGPMTASSGTLSHSGVLAGTVAVSGTPNAATWRCRIAGGDRYIEDAFGPGARFSWSQAEMVAGQAVRLSVAFDAAPAQPPGDLLAQALAALPAGAWSGNLARNAFNAVYERRKGVDADFSTYYAAPGEPPIVVVAQNTWAYSSGCYVSRYRIYYITGGGHDDGCSSEMSAFDLPTLLYRRTDDSAKLAISGPDPTAPFNTVGPFYTRRNPAGRFAPLSSHLYGGMVYVPSLDRVHIQGAAAYRDGFTSVGGFVTADAKTGQYDDAGAHGAGGDGVDVASLIVPNVRVVDAQLVPTGEVIAEAVLRVSSGSGAPRSRIIDPVGKKVWPAVGYWDVAHRPTAMGCVIPDPLNPGHLAYVADRDASSLAVFPRVDIVRNDGKAHDSIKAVPYGNAKPAAIGDGGGQRWVYMGDFIPGCRLIAAFKPSAGLFALNIDGWTWSAQLVGSPIAQPPDGVWRRFEFLPEYDAFGLFDEKGRFYVLKRPAIFA